MCQKKIENEKKMKKVKNLLTVNGEQIDRAITTFLHPKLLRPDHDDVIKYPHRRSECYIGSVVTVVGF